ncbi:glycolate oxidase iron-sulfur subunit [Rhodovarius crocodyli]|uniref:Glycolate oxidase iron-sulfur subunit n=1 Tax=Rhodovarius crocodyli TaxID=1979269 RepID=A0A437MM40_9PROT|nr:glycolate oxidase subunit GlcF [Rhodovarius crocodyli]RVT98711.1 glycolate oxidase iron-sulfur subunit [Rhodovarius crocodyli]
MQTNFTPEQLQDPELKVANGILRTCVHCGFCTATCPTFVELGDELDSPRGRIYLIKDMLESGRPASELEARHIDRCLSCLSCMTTCPSGVNYMHLVDHARRHVEETYTRPLPERALRSVLAMLLPHPGRFRWAMRLAKLGKPLRGLIPGQGTTAKRLRAMLELAPEHIPAPQPVTGTHPAEGARRGRVAMLAGCAQQVLDPEINAATIRLLTRMGYEVVVPPAAGCCGALTHHMGRHDPAMATARANILAWDAEIAAGGLDGIIVNASGCGTTVKDYGFMFRNEPEAEAAARVSALAMDITEALARFDYTPSRTAPPFTVAYHSACSLQHGQKITALPKQLLAKAGFVVKEPAEGHLCCGSAGTYNMMQPEISAKLKARKLANIRRTGAAVVAAGNIGCLTQIGAGGPPTVHTVQLLDWMAGGPKPKAIEGL